VAQSSLMRRWIAQTHFIAFQPRVLMPFFCVLSFHVFSLCVCFFFVFRAGLHLCPGADHLHALFLLADPFRATLHPPADSGASAGSSAAAHYAEPRPAGVDWSALFKRLPRSQAEADAMEARAELGGLALGPRGAAGVAGAAGGIAAAGNVGIAAPVAGVAAGPAAARARATAAARAAHEAARRVDAFACRVAFGDRFDWAVDALGDRHRAVKLPKDAAALLALPFYADAFPSSASLSSSMSSAAASGEVQLVAALVGGARLWGAMALREAGGRDKGPAAVAKDFGSGFKPFWEGAAIHACQVRAVNLPAMFVHASCAARVKRGVLARGKRCHPLHICIRVLTSRDDTAP